MASGCSFPELAYWHLVLRVCNKNATDPVRRYRENYPNQRVLDHHACLLLTADLRRQKHFMECSGMSAVRILHIMDGFKSRPSELLKTANHHNQTSAAHRGDFQAADNALEKQQLYTCHLQTVLALLEYCTMRLQDMQSVDEFCNSMPKTQH
jgi:hypothetical protein